MAENEKIKKQRTLLQKIVNVFLYTGIGIIILIFFALGFSQTSTFRGYLKNFVVKKANETLNGKISIGKIDGTLFTSLVLRNTTVNMGEDTLLKAGIIEVKTSPLQIFWKKIYIRKFELKDAKISFIKDSDGKLNISKLFPPSKHDTSHSPFPFQIIAPNFKLTHVSFSVQNSGMSGSKRYYDSLNPGDLRIKDINLSLKAAADINKKNVELYIDKLSCSPNLNFFDLKSLSGKFLINRGGINVSDLYIATKNSKILLNADARGLNPLDSTFSSELDKAKLNVTLIADKFNFNDLSSWVPSTNILQGDVNLKLHTEGTLENLRIKELNLNYLKTHLQLTGNILDVDEPKTMFINADFIKSSINEPDVHQLLPGISIPVLNNLGGINLDTLKFHGNPLNFKTSVALNTPEGLIAVNGRMNLLQNPVGYNLNLVTKNLDLSQLIGYKTSFNSYGKIKGKGLSPDKTESSIRFFVYNSIFNGHRIDSLNLKADAKNKLINYSLLMKSVLANSDLKGKFDFNEKEKPTYDLTGVVNNLNLEDFISDNHVNSNLNFDVDASGDHFNLDKMNLFLNLHLNRSQINGINIDSARTIVDIRSNDNGERIINLISDLADITFEGKFSLNQSIKFLVGESDLVSSAFKQKLNQIMNPDSASVGKGNIILPKTAAFNNTNPVIVPQHIKYLVEFKNFDLLSLLLKSSHLRLNGNISGVFSSNSDSAHVTVNTKFDYIKYWSENNVFFLSNLDLKLNLNNNLHDSSFAGLNTNLHLTMDRLFVGSDFRNIFLDFKLDSSKALVNMSGQIENFLKTKLIGNIDLTSSTVKTDFKQFDVSYNNYNLKNEGDVSVDYSPENISVNKFKLIHDNGFVSIDGNLSRKDQQDLKIVINGIQGKDLSSKILEAPADNSLGANINISGEIKGNFEEPLINLTVNADSISFRNTNFGYLKSNFNYNNQNLDVDLKFLDTTLYKNEPPLVLKGDVPINLSFLSTKSRFPKSKQINLRLTASNFNLGALGNIVPMLNRLKGRLNTDLKIGGTIENIKPEGDLTISSADFVAAANNLEYNADLKLGIKDEKITLNNFRLSNVSGTKKGGSIIGSGYADLKNFELSSANIDLTGTLKVLSDASKAVSPNLYGDLVISTDGNLVISSDGKKFSVKAPIIVQEAKLTFPPPESAYHNSAENFVYRFAPDTAQNNSSEMDFASLVRLSKSKNSADSEDVSEKPMAVDYVVNIKVRNEAVLKFLLSKELNQSLTAIINGNLQYENTAGKTNVQGELTLLEGSTLQFLKTFEAAGTIRFESDLSNPNLNIVATYKNYYTPPDAEAKEEQVAVEIKLNGPLNDLSKNLIQDKNNIAVYMGADNITNNKPDPTKDVSDAVMFILTGKFPSDLTPQQQSQAVTQSGTIATQSAVTSTGISLAGSLLGGFLNHYLGDYVRGVELRTVGSITKFNLVGKVNKFRYSIGGSTDVFQDLNQTNVKIEYPLLQNLLIRLERKDAITQTTTSNEMINELGLKYRFEF